MSRKNCNGCKALYINQAGTADCDLGIEIVQEKKGKILGVDIYEYRPKDPSCPKPKNNKDWSNCHLSHQAGLVQQ